MSYNPINWQNDKIGGTKVNATNLNIMDKGIADAHDMLADHDNKINDFANQQIPEEYLQQAVDNYIAENQAGLASKEETEALDVKIDEVNNQLSSDIVEIESILPKGYAKVNTTIENGAWTNTHTINVIEGGDYKHLTELEVKEGEKFKISCWGNKWYSPFYIFDDNDTMLASYHSLSDDTSSGDVKIEDYEVTMPSGAKYLCVNAFYTEGNQKAEVYKYDLADISDIDSEVKVLKAIESLKRLIVTNATAESDYSRLLSNLPINSFVGVNGGWFTDFNLSEDWYTVITLPTTQNTSDLSQRVQIAISGTIDGLAIPTRNIFAYRYIIGDIVGEWVYLHYGYGERHYYAFGDSVCRGNRGDASKSPYSWVDMFGKQHNLITHNLAIGGQGYLSTRYQPKAIDTIKETDITNANLITLSFAINDASDTVDIGTYTDTNENTVMGQVYNCISYIYSQTKKCQVIVCGSTPQNGTRSERLETINNQLKLFCEHYNISFVDLHDCPINAFNGNDTSITDDGTHFNNEGYKLLGQFMCGKLSALYGYK